jgi:hypothetical protein
MGLLAKSPFGTDGHRAQVPDDFVERPVARLDKGVALNLGEARTLQNAL